MLVIRDVQLQSFIATSDDDLVLLIAQAELRINPSRVDGVRPVRLRSMTRIAMETARSVGLKNAEDIAGFAAVMFEVSPRFHLEPSIAAALADETFQPGERLAVLFERTSAENWADAEKLYDENIWFGSTPSGPPDASNGEESAKPVNYLELTIEQVQKVEKLAKQHRSSPTRETASQLEREIEKLCVYQNSAKGAPKQRAMQAYEEAKALVLGRAVTQKLPA